MRFLHLADIHLGKSVNEINMIADQKYILQQIIDLAVNRKADAILISGDIYDKSVPSEEAVRLLDWFLSTCADRNLRVCMISGNHDSDERLNFGSTLFESKNVHIAGKYNGTVSRVSVEDEFGTVHVYMLPYVKASLVRTFHPDLDTSSYDAAVRAALSNANVDPKERNILMAHQFVTAGGNDPAGAGSENTRPEFVGAVEKVDAGAFDDFDYVALGHIHRPQKVGRDTVRYAGSPLKYSLSEATMNKSVPLVTMKEKGDVEVELLPLVPLHDLRHIKGPIDELLKKENVVEPEDYIYVTLTDEDVIPQAMDRVRIRYPNAISLDYDNAHTRAIESFDVSQAIAARSIEDLFGAFYKQVYGLDPKEEEWDILLEAAGKAGLKDETD